MTWIVITQLPIQSEAVVPFSSSPASSDTRVPFADLQENVFLKKIALENIYIAFWHSSDFICKVTQFFVFTLF